MAWTTHWIGILRHKDKYRHLLSAGLLMLIGLILSSEAWASPLDYSALQNTSLKNTSLKDSPLENRIQTFPHWSNLPPTQPAQGDLVYPDWFQGAWQVDSTLVDLDAPLAPDIVTPGFEDNRRYLHQPLRFRVRFLPRQQILSALPYRSPWQSWKQNWKGAWQGWIPDPMPRGSAQPQAEIVADRSFNGFNITQAYLAETDPQKAAQVISVEVDPDNPNRQITTLSQHSQTWQLVTIVTDRATEIPGDDRFHFITTEISQQFFRNRPQVYLNRVETTTAYHFDPTQREIQAEQFTAVYLSPQDPQYFQVFDQPVALYHYHLNLYPDPSSAEIHTYPRAKSR